MHTAAQPDTSSADAAAPVARVAVAGATGYAGQELLRLLSRHPAVALTAAMSSCQTGASSRRLPALTRLWNGTIVPLSSEAVRVIDSIERGGGRIVGSPYLFTRDGKQPITHFDRLKQRLDAEVKKLGDIPEFTTHDFRRSCVTALAGKGFDPIAIDLLLGHTPSGLREIARIYNRYEHKDTRRKALDAWAEMIAAPPATDNVRKLKRVAR